MVQCVVAIIALFFQLLAALNTKNWKRRTVYQIVTDRFALEAGQKDTCYEMQVECREGAYCGGSWKGIMDKLDYISGMGFDAIWISPIVNNTECGYHGYWMKHLHELNDRMGTASDLKLLVDTAHSKGIMVMFDGVLNHVGPKSRGSRPSDFNEYAPLNKAKYFHGGWKLATLDGTEREECEHFNFSTFNLSLGHCQVKCAPDQYFREACWLGERDGQLPDLRQEDPTVERLLIDQVKKDLSKFKFDGLRLDSAAYMNKTFLHKIKTEALEDTYTVADVALEAPTEFFASYQYTEEARFIQSLVSKEEIRRIKADHIHGDVVDGILNYELFNALRKAFISKAVKADNEKRYDRDNAQGSFLDLKYKWLKLNSTYHDVGSNMNFIDSHDQRRWFYDSPHWDTYKNALTVAFFLPGIPVILYGSEQGISGGSEDNDIRQALWSNSPGYDQSSHLYQWTRRLVAARKAMLHSLSDDNMDQVEQLVAEEHFMSFQRGEALLVITKHPTPLLEDIVVSVPTSIAANTLLCDALQLDTPKYHCNYVNGRGMLEVTLEGRPRIMTRPQGAAISPFLLALVRGLVTFWFLPLVVFLLVRSFQSRLIYIVEPPAPQEVDGPLCDGPADDGHDSSSQVVLYASIEHMIALSTQHKTLKVVVGGLGKGAGLLCQHHPGPLICVHPCMSEQDYDFAHHDGYITAKVMGQEKTCEVLTYDREPINHGPRVTFVLVDHEIFRDRKDGIYPAPNTRANVLAFYSLWNQVVGKIIDRFRPDVFHCADYHAAMAVLYIERPLPVVVALHNAEYQGGIDTQQMGLPQVSWFADMFNLSDRVTKNECMVDGTFNMLWPIIRYIKKHQRGYGISAVSRSYAQECFQKYSIFWGLPELRGIENCLPDCERFQPEDSGEAAYWKQKRRAKEAVQEEYDLEVNPEAHLFVFLGRWVKQKGMDYIADVTDWMLTTYPEAQLIMIGPVGDSYGSYARMRMQGLMEIGKFQKRLFVYAGFLSVSRELKLAADFCLMPSRDEPFGYVDAEFAWHGALIVGSFRGGLGKVPGFYYKTLNKDSAAHCQDCLKRAITAAMSCDHDIRTEMTRHARTSTFPVQEWRNELLRFYDVARQGFHGHKARRTTSRTEASSDGPETPLMQEVQEPQNLQAVTVDANGRQARSRPHAEVARDEGVPPIARSSPSSGRSEMVRQMSPALGRPTPGGVLATIASVGDDLANISAQDPLSHLHVAFPAQELEHRDNVDSISVLSLETSPSQERHTAAGSWSRQVTPMLSGMHVPAEFSRGISGLSSEEREARVEDSLPLRLEEFLRQAPVEDDVMGLVEAKAAIATFTKQSKRHAEVLLEETLWELELCRETQSSTMLLGRTFCGVLVIDWLISLAFITGPLMSLALTGVSAYSETTGLTLSDQSWEVQRLMMEGVFTIAWTIASIHCRSHHVMAAAVFSRIFQIIVAFQKELEEPVKVGEAFSRISVITAGICGATQAGDITLLYFNFMGQSVGDISKLAVRSAVIMALRSMSFWLILPMCRTPKAVRTFLFVFSVAMCTVLPFCILQAPALYREFRLPNFWSQFRGFWRLKLAALIGLSMILHGFSYAPDILFVIWRSRAPRPDTFQEFCISSAAGTLIAPVVLSIIMQQAPDTAINIVKAFACFSSPVLALRCWPMLEAIHADGVSRVVDLLSLTSVILDVVSVMACSVAMLSTLGSRWRFCAYMCMIHVLKSFAAAVSFPIMQASISSSLPVDLRTAMEPKELTNELMLRALLPCIPAFVCRVLAFRFFDQEMLGMLWTQRHRKVEQLIRRRNNEDYRIDAVGNTGSSN